jgi:hypothetical protein
MFGIEIQGPENIQVFLRDIEVTSRRLTKELPKAFATRIHNQLKWRVYNQKYTGKFPSLSPKYLSFKKRKGLSPKMFVATGALIRSIRVRKVGDFWYVTVPKTRHKGTGLSYVELASILEFGSPQNGLPPRPLWAATAAQAVQDYPKFVKDFIRKFYSEQEGFNVGKGRGGRNIIRIEVEF